ncbi:assimilatory sulfite reductase (NADPH) flavoprotein subunit [Verrucomicrobiaceae bacterium R5-34]|nr:assimilatory sulfite reductase (NADPH) flavoprotein subunit [Verrucomicrobiaceae bacterium R5-34]
MIKFPAHSPFSPEQQQQLSGMLSSLNPPQVAWLGGFLSGVQSDAAATAQPVAAKKLTVLYGTESGNSEELAEQVFKTAKKKGFKAQIVNMSETTASALKDAGSLLVVVSTWGDGDPPEAAEEFYKDLMSADVSLDGVEFSVCALGDTGYDQFCETGKQIDTRLEKLGAKRVADRVDCDVDYEESFQQWSDSVWKVLGDAAAPAVADFAAPVAQVYDKKNPFPAEVIDNQLLSGDHSAKETIHLEFSLEGSGFDYEPGDVLAVIPRNAKDVVDAVLKASGLDADATVDVKGVGNKKLSAALTEDLDITGLSRKIVSAWQQISGSEELAKLLDDAAKGEFKDWSYGREIIDLLEEHPAKSVTAQQFVDILRKLPPRLYSIASSPKAHPGEVHLTVAAVRYESHGKSRKGVASTYLADDAKKGTPVSVYVHKNKNFRLPENGDTPIIMVGPGTGIAPFRAFVEERAETQAKGDSWLFFGDQKYNEDFLYQLELQDHLKNGSLSRLDVAFSRDQPEKVYVQHKMLENAKELWQWLEKGAHFYVCGDASRMAKDVHDALLEIIATEGGKSPEEADTYLAALKKDKRYQRDVY